MMTDNPETIEGLALEILERGLQHVRAGWCQTVLGKDATGRLFFPSLHKDPGYGEMTPAVAARVLRNMVKTHEVDWRQALREVRREEMEKIR